MPALGQSVSQGNTAYHIRPGEHDLTDGDWVRFAQFISHRFAE
jgi:hypothetical protein